MMLALLIQIHWSVHLQVAPRPMFPVKIEDRTCKAELQSVKTIKAELINSTIWVLLVLLRLQSWQRLEMQSETLVASFSPRTRVHLLDKINKNTAMLCQGERAMPCTGLLTLRPWWELIEVLFLEPQQTKMPHKAILQFTEINLNLTYQVEVYEETSWRVQSRPFRIRIKKKVPIVVAFTFLQCLWLQLNSKDKRSGSETVLIRKIKMHQAFLNTRKDGKYMT